MMFGPSNDGFDGVQCMNAWATLPHMRSRGYTASYGSCSCSVPLGPSAIPLSP